MWCTHSDPVLDRGLHSLRHQGGSCWRRPAGGFPETPSAKGSSPQVARVSRPTGAGTQGPSPLPQFATTRKAPWAAALLAGSAEDSVATALTSSCSLCPAWPPSLPSRWCSHVCSPVGFLHTNLCLRVWGRLQETWQPTPWHLSRYTDLSTVMVTLPKERDRLPPDIWVSGVVFIS